MAGLLLILYAYQKQQPYVLAAGALLATAKPQGVYLLLIVLAVYMLQTFQLRVTLTAGAATLAIVIPSIVWGGAGWLAALGTKLITSISMMSMLNLCTCRGL